MVPFRTEPPPMDVSDLSFLGGLLMGLAAGLHCAGMCGGIASTLTFLLAPQGGPGSRARVLMTAQAGRVAAYVAAGAVVGTFGSAIYGAFDHTTAYRILQWGAAVTLAWIGLSVAGFIPAFTMLDRLMAPLSRRISALAARTSGSPAGVAAPLVAGLLWGLLPCAAVYGALFTAMLTGSGAGGATLMFGFGLGTLPAVTAAAFGVTSLTRLARGPATRVAVGLSIAAVGVLGLLLTVPGSPICITN